ncbi:MAG: PLP-dependent transferase [Myxococcales bacterium FL481]|nr:MAG: PLP-dependent transferase [Myxococcales bacterium FL481]
MAIPPSPGPQTLAIHAGAPTPRIHGAGVLPIFQGTLFELGADDPSVRYPRLSNTPNHDALHGKLAALEGAEAALVTASGMAAITSTLLAVAGGGHVLVQDTLYGGTHGFLIHTARTLGLQFDFVDAGRPETWAAKLRPDTKAFYTEAMSNPCLTVADHRAVVAFCRKHQLLGLIDNTFASPCNFTPLALGYDVSLHSATKYLNGHSDVVAGAVIGTRDLVAQVRSRVDHLGGTVDAFTCYLLDRGLKTLPLRIREQNANAQRIAEFLDGHPGVHRVHYPGLSGHPQHARACELFAGHGGVVTADLHDEARAATRLVHRVELFTPTPSLGGVESLVTIPAQTSHAELSRAERQQLGVGEGLVRLSIGIENADDLIADLDRALR